MNAFKEKHNARSSYRLPIELLIELKTNEQSSEEFCSNLSSSGIFVSTIQPQPIGSKIELCFSLPHNHEKFSIEGEVVWIRTQSEGEGPFGMGIKFGEISREKAESLNKAINYYSSLVKT
ncbi:MAG: TIGR02266 family protein [Bdellovibrionota bacterium]